MAAHQAPLSLGKNTGVGCHFLLQCMKVKSESEVIQSCSTLSDFTFTFPFHALEKEMATHSSVLAWRIPGTGEPGGLPSMRLHRVGLVGGSTFRRTPISQSPLDKNPMPGHLSELHPVNEVNTNGQFFRASFGKKPQVPKTARQAASLPGDISRGKRSSMPQPKTRPDSPVLPMVFNIFIFQRRTADAGRKVKRYGYKET